MRSPKIVLYRKNVMARCSSCKSRWRVLPGDVLPHKTCGLCVIEFECAAYSQGGLSLRGVAWYLLYPRLLRHATLTCSAEDVMVSWVASSTATFRAK